MLWPAPRLHRAESRSLAADPLAVADLLASSSPAGSAPEKLLASWIIAGWSLAVELAGPGAERFAAPLQTHCTSGVAKPDLHLTIELREGWRSSGREGVICDPKDAAAPARISFDQPVLRGVLERTSGGYQGRFTVAADGPGPLEIVLRACLSVLCEQAGQLLIHASGVVRDGGVWLFCGPAGCGKSTIALELCAGAVPLAVDRAVLVAEPDGSFTAHSTPFSDHERRLTGPKSGPLAGLCLIEQAAEHRVEELPPWDVITALLPQTLTFSRAPVVVERVMATVGRLAESGLCCKLYFAPNDGLWQLLSRRTTGAR